MLKELLGNSKNKQTNNSTNKSMSNKDMNRLISNNVNNSVTSFHNTLDYFKTGIKKRNLNDSINKLTKTCTKTSPKPFSGYLQKKEASIDSNLYSSIETNFKSSLSLNSPKQRNKRSLSNKPMTNSKSVDINITNFVDNLKLLENLISEIKTRGFDATKQEILFKVKIKKELEYSINTLKKKKASVGLQSKLFENNVTKLTNETTNFGLIKDRVSREVFFKNKELPRIIRDIENVKNEMFIKKNDTTYLNTEILQFENNNNLIKDEIGRMNKEISDVQKEKENAKNSILLLKKHILIIQEKIYQEDQKCKDFLSNVSNFVDKSFKSKNK